MDEAHNWINYRALWGELEGKKRVDDGGSPSVNTFVLLVDK